MGNQKIIEQDPISLAVEAWQLSNPEAIVLMAASDVNGAHGHRMVNSMRAISAELEGIGARDATKVNRPDGTVYRIINRFLRDKLLVPHTPDPETLEPRQGPKRKYYKTTELGAKILQYNVELNRQRVALYDAREETM